MSRNWGLPAFRAKQLHEWLLKGEDFPAMTNLPRPSARASPARVSQPVEIFSSIRSKADGTEKLLYRLRDGNIIEGVVMRYHHGDTLCVSTQVGCRMGCAFCASTLGGLVRNLTPARCWARSSPWTGCFSRKAAACQRMVLRAARAAGQLRKRGEVSAPGHGRAGLNLSARAISLSTCAW